MNKNLHPYENEVITGRLYDDIICFYYSLVYQHLTFINTIGSFQKKLNEFLIATNLSPDEAIISCYINEDCDVLVELTGSRPKTEIEKLIKTKFYHPANPELDNDGIY
jgi:hypothetical protein